VSAEAAHDHHARRLLAEVEAGNGVSQRSLAQRTGIALGLTNLLLKRLVRKGWIRIIHVQPNRVKYLITPAGVAEKARMSRNYLAHSIRFYAEARDRIAERFRELLDDWPSAGNGFQRRIVFYGAGEVAEIGYVCLQGSGLTLVGVVDAGTREQFFEFNVFKPPDLVPGALAGVPYDRVVVMDFAGRTAIEDRLRAAGLGEFVFWV
jgi:DNA-binding MarR family transcriptional regulator